MEKRPRQALELEFEDLDDFVLSSENAPRPSWLIPELIPSQGTLLLQGTPGGGKTWLCLCIAKEAISRGRKVFFVEEESGRWAMGKRFKEMAFPAKSPVRVLHRKGFRVDVREKLGALLTAMMPHSEPVVILDPLVHLWIGDENKTADVSALVQHLALLRSMEDALIVIPTHPSKGAVNSGTPSVYGARGSSVLAGWFDCILNVEYAPREPGTEAMTITPVKSRDIEMYDRRHLVLRKGTGEISIKTDREERADKLEAQIGDFVAARGPVSKHQIEQAVGGRAEWIRRVVDDLVTRGFLKHSTSSRSGTPLLELNVTSSGPLIKGGPGTKSVTCVRDVADEVGRSGLAEEANAARQRAFGRETDARWEEIRKEK